MSAQHTPGPWTFSRWDQFGDARFYVAQAEGAPYTPDYSDVATLVAETCSGERVTIQEANARLIAAAPELLSVVEKFVDAASASHDALAFSLMCDTFIEEARAVFAKATGVQK